MGRGGEPPPLTGARPSLGSPPASEGRPARAGNGMEARPPGADVGLRRPPWTAGAGSTVGDVLVGVPFRHRLSTKLLGVTAVLALAALAALAFAERRIQRELVGSLERSTALLGDAIQTSAQQAMLDGRSPHAYEVMARGGRLEGI